MLRKTLMTLTAIAVLGAGSTAMAMHGGGSMGGGGGMGGGTGVSGGVGRGGSFGGRGAGIATMPRGSAGPMMMRGRNIGAMTHGPITAAMAGGRVQGWGGRTAWGHFHDHFHHRFHHRNFFAFGVGGPIYDYAYTSCWTQVPTRYGWRRVYVCGGDYGY